MTHSESLNLATDHFFLFCIGGHNKLHLCKFQCWCRCPTRTIIAKKCTICFPSGCCDNINVISFVCDCLLLLQVKLHLVFGLLFLYANNKIKHTHTTTTRLKKTNLWTDEIYAPQMRHPKVICCHNCYNISTSLTHLQVKCAHNNKNWHRLLLRTFHSQAANVRRVFQIKKKHCTEIDLELLWMKVDL